MPSSLLDPPVKQPETSGSADIIDHITWKTAEYLRVPSVVGYEGIFLSHLQQDFQKLGLEAHRLRGALRVHGPKPDSAIVTAHLDRHGLISLGHDQFVYAAQYIREIKYGEPNRTSEKEIAEIGRRFNGEVVTAYDPITGAKLGEGTIQASASETITGSALFNVKGMPDLSLGIPVAYDRKAMTEDGYFKGQIDNAISLAVIHALYKNGFQGTAIIPADEEIGKSWTHIAAALQIMQSETKNLIVIDTSPYTDARAIDEGMVILRHRDGNDVFNAALVARLRERCETLGVPYQFKDEILLAAGKLPEQLGSTELGKLIKHSDRRWSGATVQIPTLMYHTSRETTSLSAIGNYYRFLHNILIDAPLALDGQ